MQRDKHRDNHQRLSSIEKRADKDNRKRRRKNSSGRDKADKKKESNDHNI